MYDGSLIRVLLVEDDEDDYVLTRELMSELQSQRYALDWVDTFDKGLESMCLNQHDVVLVDYRLGARNGVELLREAVEHGCRAPVILLTGSGKHQVDLEAMQAGAADYLVKAELRADALERSIRYAIQRKRAAAVAAFEQARLAAFGAEVGLALTRRDSLQAILERCAKAMAKYLNAHLAQIFTFDEVKHAFDLRVSAGALGEGAVPAEGWPSVALDPALLAKGEPVLLAQLPNDPRLLNPEVVRRNGLVAYAAYPLLLEDQLVGLMAIFCRQPLSEQILQEMGSVANGISLCIQRKRSEEALDASEVKRKLAEHAIQKLAAFPQVNPNPVLEFAADGTLSYSNEAAAALAQSLGKANLIEILPAQPETIVRECLKTGEKRLREEVRINGRIVSWSFFPVVASQVVHCYGADITDVLNLEAQFRHAQKLESVGQLAAGVAHDFNNILTVIQGYCDCLLTRSEHEPATLAALKQIADAARRAAALTRQLLLFSRKQVIQTKILDLNGVLQNVANMLLRLVGEDIALESSYLPDLPPIEADTGMLEQVVMNLVVNSRDAMPKGGRLSISTSAVELNQSYQRQHPESRPGRFVCLTVSDTGCGMDAKTLDRIFEPFFSTKEVGKGSGLGLATVYGIVKQHQGWIEVQSELGRGTTFKIYFPVSHQPAGAPAEPAAAPEPVRGGRETILVVEDEPVLRELVCEVLQQYHYHVLEAASGVEALRLWDEYDGRIDLVLTDMVMPQGMTGRDLVAQLKQRRPELKVIYSSGYSPDVMNRDFGQTDTVFLSKPYLPPQLALTVRECLDGSRRRVRKAALT